MAAKSQHYSAWGGDTKNLYTLTDDDVNRLHDDLLSAEKRHGTSAFWGSMGSIIVAGFLSTCAHIIVPKTEKCKRESG